MQRNRVARCPWQQRNRADQSHTHDCLNPALRLMLRKQNRGKHNPRRDRATKATPAGTACKAPPAAPPLPQDTDSCSRSHHSRRMNSHPLLRVASGHQTDRKQRRRRKKYRNRFRQRHGRIVRRKRTKRRQPNRQPENIRRAGACSLTISANVAASAAINTQETKSTATCAIISQMCAASPVFPVIA